MEYLDPTTSSSRRCRTTCSSGTTRRGSTTACRSTRCPSRPASARPSTRGLVCNFHPMFRDAEPPLHFYYGNDNDHPRPGQLRGRRHPGHRQRRRDDRHGRADDAAGRGVPGPRSTSRDGSVTKVIAVELPKTRAFMHLDTAMTMIDRDAFSVYPYLPDTLRSFTLTPVGDRRRLPGHRERRALPGRRRGARDRQGARAAHTDRRPRRPARAVGRRQQLPRRRPGRDLRLRAQHDDQHVPAPATASRSSRSPVASSAAAGAARAACPARSSVMRRRELGQPATRWWPGWSA